MSSRRLGMLAVVGMLVGTVASAADPIWRTDLNAARQEAVQRNCPILVHFGATWCPPCRKMESIVLNQPGIVRHLQANVIPVKLDVDQNKNLVYRFGIEQFPTDLFLEPNGEPMIVTSGFKDPAEYQDLISRAAQRHAHLVAAREKAATPVRTTPDSEPDTSVLVKSGTPELMLDGYCPVTLVTSRKWERGNQEIRSEFKGQMFCFKSEEARSTFQKSPEKYVPQYMGCDPVLVWTSDRAVPGSIEFGAFYDDQLYLFTSDENRKAFKSTPDKYLSTRVVLNVDQIETLFR